MNHWTMQSGSRCGRRWQNRTDCPREPCTAYEAAYRKGGFPGLKPQDRESKRSPKLPENFDELLEQAIQLKREVPKRSVRQIIYILELEGRVAPES